MWAILWSSSARAHGGSTPIRGVYDWSSLPKAEPGAWIVWEFYPSIVLGCLGLFALYAYMAERGRERWQLAPAGPTAAEWRRLVVALLTVFFALQGPMHELADVYLFSGHMVQHLLIQLVFPPLLIRAIPAWMWLPLIAKPWAMGFGKVVTHPVVAFVIASATLYLWHVPAMYDWALQDHNVHIVEHLMFMTAAVIMWWPAWSTLPELPALSPGWRMIYLFLLTVPMKALGALITVSDYVLYRYYATQPRVFDLDPLMDQRLGGLIMWLPGGLVFWFTIGWTFFTTYYADYLRQHRPRVAEPIGAMEVQG